MADQKISQLTDGTSFQSGDEAVVNRSGTNYKVDPTQFGDSIDVTGTVTADGLTVDGNAKIAQNFKLNFGDFANSFIQTSSTTLIISSADPTVFKNGGAETMRITSSGNVGIGTSSPSYPLTVDTGAGTFSVRQKGGSSVTLASDSALTYFGSTHEFYNAAGDTERARIDTSGNLLVGTTDDTPSANNDSGGASLRGSGQLNVSRDGAAALDLNRKTSDGDIAVFRKDGSTVGSIGAGNGDLTIGTGVTTLKYVDALNTIHPNGTGSGSDGNTSLGWSNNRFKDLYLSGGVYLGGTGAANLLDDYETGTWTPTTNSDATGAFSSAAGSYTKIGNIVHVRAVFTVSTNFTDNKIGGLPFTVGSGGASFSSAYGWNGSVIAVGITGVVGTAVEGDTRIDLINDGNTASSHIPTTTGSTYRLSVTYQV